MLIECAFSKESILFLIFGNHLPTSNTLLDPIMFAGNKNFSYTETDTKQLFHFVQNELYKINKQFIANEFSLFVRKTKNTFLDKSNKKNDVSLFLLILTVNGEVISKTLSIKLVEVSLGNHLFWNEYIPNKVI